MTYLDEACGKTDPPDLYAPDIPDLCPWCGHELEELTSLGLCPACEGEVEP